MARIKAQALSTVYPNGVRAVDALDLEIADGEFFALLGPSGCGKTTLLRTLAGLEQASEGTVAIGEKDMTAVEPGRRKVAMVFQDYALFPHMTVAENIAYPLKVRRQPKATQREVAERTANSLSLAGLLDRRPGQLSGGQQQRVALARAVAIDADVLLLDEPLSNLDARLRLEARTFLKRLQREIGITTVFVTHDQAEALALADRIAVMESGRIRQLGSPREVFGRPSDTFVANFIGSTPMNLLDGTIEGGNLAVAGATLPTPAALPDGTKVTVGIRPEYLTREPAGRGITGTVSTIENLGVSSLVTLECPDGSLLGMTVREQHEPRAGAEITAVPEQGRLLLYSKEDGTLLA
ncbi:ABC transporter ATP-binding protein [Kibdelosporangium phytohabitans]|uniref:ABC transporter n=1 Tax=Kibdelosporangium phytohabitans TaxID=860235 RepID=A0A0N9IC86_9PSEU|nr:ABC transporter ATP-binding protein [Kibdelosporangium phytohabitans]ALG12830.1 ABC transporter [Kibdelosporangium phytohabitans]MBE1464520.1 multiple sugar transport system ATP-binding protein [Kibdelosporangium phytohabitans]